MLDRAALAAAIEALPETTRRALVRGIERLARAGEMVAEGGARNDAPRV